MTKIKSFRYRVAADRAEGEIDIEQIDKEINEFLNELPAPPISFSVTTLPVKETNGVQTTDLIYTIVYDGN